MTVVITGMGIAVPKSHVPQTSLYESMHQLCCDSDEHRRVMQLIYQGAGVNERGTVLLENSVMPTLDSTTFFQPRDDEDDRGPTTQARMEKYEDHAFDLALESCQSALARADQDLSEITHLVTVSCSGFYAPGWDIELIQELGLSPETTRTHVGFMGCHGAFNGLRVAKAYVEANPNAVVLMCSVELCSLHHHYGWQTDKVIANALFADGSAAVVVRAVKPDQVPLQTRYELVRNGTHLLPGTKNAMSWRIGDHGFEMTLSQKVPSIIEENLRPWMTGFLAQEGLTIEEVKGWAIHPGGPRILDACLTALSLSSDDVSGSRDILARHGNMSSATILFLLEKLQGELPKGPTVALGFGPGLTIEAMLLNSAI